MTASAHLEGRELDDQASRSGGARRQLRYLWVRVKSGLSSGSAVPGLVGITWLALSLTLLLWMWGLNPLVFPSPDEAVVRYAARLVRAHGSPIMKVPFPDPEDLAHPRSWVTLGNSIVPTYAPVSLYLLGYVLRMRSLGLLVVALLPTTALGAFAAGIAQLLARSRRWLALLAPPLAFPAFYWLLRPWVNISLLLTCLCWAFFFWARWRATNTLRNLSLAALLVGLGTAIRPDYAAPVLLAALLLCLAANPGQWKASLVVFSLAGASALGSNLVLNTLLTGHPLRAAYQVALDRQWGAQSTSGAPGLGALRVLLVPMGWPVPHVAWNVFVKYWLAMGPIALVLVGQLAIVPLLFDKPRISRVLYALVFMLLAFFVYTRLHDDVFGGRQRHGWAEHSVPRYLTPAYLFAVVPPLIFLGRLERRWLFFPGALLALAAASAGAYEVGVRQPSSFKYLNGFVPTNTSYLEAVKRHIPNDAMVYCVTLDKVVWSQWRLGTIDNLEPSAASIARAVEAGESVYMLDPKFETPSHRRLGSLIAKRGLIFVPIDMRHGVFRVQGGPVFEPEHDSE